MDELDWDQGMELAVPDVVPLIEQQWPELRPVSAELVGHGCDNCVFRVNGALIFRFPREATAARLMEAENRALGVLAEHLTLPVPRPRWMGRPGAGYPFAFTGYPLIAGETAPRRELDDARRAALAAPLATFLKQLHGLGAGEVDRAGLGPDRMQSLDAARRRYTAERQLEWLVERGVEVPAARVLEIIDAAPPVTGMAAARRVVHGDLHAGQLVLDDAARLVGVLDWTYCHAGDPAVDLAVAHALLPASAHGIFFEIYGNVEEPAWRSARARAAWQAVALAFYALNVGNAPLARENAGVLARVVAG